MPHRIALVSATQALALDEDLAPLAAALAARGAEVSAVPWDAPDIDWSSYRLALLRSTWDYTDRIGEFLAWCERADAATTLLNPLPVVRWNTDKHYLAALAEAGVDVVPGVFLEPGDSPERMPDYHEFVVKPAIGAGSRDAQRYVSGERAAALGHARRLLDQGRSVLVQPYLDSVDTHGETALMFFNGRYSHAIRKGPLLRRGEGPTQGLFAPERITPREPSAAERALAERTLAAIPFAGPQLYARVDLIHDGGGRPRVLELELVEPSLFFTYAEGTAERFAGEVLGRL